MKKSIKATEYLLFVIILLFTLFTIGIIQAANAESIYLSDLNMSAWTVYKGSSNDSNPERSPGIDDTYRYGETISIGGVEYDKGLSVHPGADKEYAELSYDISSGKYKYFTATVGKDLAAAREVGEEKLYGTYVSFEVLVDGVVVGDSGMLDYMETYAFVVSITGGKLLTLRTTDGGDGIYCDTSSWGNAMLWAEKPAMTPQPTKSATAVPETMEKPVVTQPPDVLQKDYAYISDMTWTDAKAYMGTSRTEPVNRDVNLYDEALSINWELFDKGICMHAADKEQNTYIDINIEGLGYKTFAAYVGIADSGTHDVSMGKVKFIVVLDGAEVYRSEEVLAGEDPLLVSVNVTDAKMLRLSVNNVDGISGDWAAWGNAIIGAYDTAEEMFTTAAEDIANSNTPEPTTENTVSPTQGNKVTATPTTEVGKSNFKAPVVIAAVCTAAAIGAVFIVLLIKRKKKK